MIFHLSNNVPDIASSSKIIVVKCSDFPHSNSEMLHIYFIILLIQRASWGTAGDAENHLYPCIWRPSKYNQELKLS